MKSCPHCGVVLTKVRSVPDHNRFFAVIAAAFDHWRNQHEFQPDSSEHLRAWLLCKAGYRNVALIPIEDGSPAVAKLAMLATEAAIKAAGSYAFVRQRGLALAVFSAKSIAFDRLSQKDFWPIRQAVEDIIAVEIGVTAEQLLQAKENSLIS